jgi:hypothetical protein
MASTFAMAEPAEDFIASTSADIQTGASDINAAIKAKGANWVAGATSMSALSPAERKTRLGAFFPTPGEAFPSQPTSALSVPESGPPPPSFSVTLPAVLDWRNYIAGTSALSVNPGNYVTPVRNQASCGDCWVFASVAGLESRTLITQNTPGVKLDLSEELVATCDSGDTPSATYGNACMGGIPVTGFFSNGIPLESCDPYSEQNSGDYMRGHCSNVCSSYSDGLDTYVCTGSLWVNNYWSGIFPLYSYWYGNGTPATVDTLKNALYQYGPIVVSFEVFEDFFFYKSGIYSYVGPVLPSGKPDYDVGGHIVLLVGYDDGDPSTGGGYFICKNSWGTGWGEGGFFRISYNDVGGTKPYYDGITWNYDGPFFGGYAVAYTGALPPCLSSSVSTPSPNSIVSKKMHGRVCTIVGSATTNLQKFLKKVEISTDGGTTWHAARDISGKGTWATWSYRWPLPQDGTYTLMPMATDNYTNTQGPGITVMVDSTLPTSIITAPSKGSALNGASYLITGTATDNLSGVFRVDVSTDGGKTWHPATITSGSGTTSATWSYNWTLSDGVYTIKSRAMDKALNVEKLLASAAVGVTVPSVVTLNPITPNGNSITATASLVNTAGTPVSGAYVSFYCAKQGTSTWALKSSVKTDGSGTCTSHAFTLHSGSYQVKAVNKFAAGKLATSNIVTPVVIDAVAGAQE